MDFQGILIGLLAGSALLFTGYKLSTSFRKAESTVECGCGDSCPCKSGKN